MPRRILIVGATGVLRPATLTLAARGEDVWALARDGGRLAALAAEADGTVSVVAVDHGDVHSLADRLVDVTRAGRFDAAIRYCPSASLASLAVMDDVVDGRIVTVETSEAARPVASEDFVLRAAPVGRHRRLVLGWSAGPVGARWHTPAEISAAALDVLASGTDRILGSVRPWSARPS